MRINFQALEKLGFRVAHDPDEDSVEITPRGDDNIMYDARTLVQSCVRSPLYADVIVTELASRIETFQVLEGIEAAARLAEKS